MTVYVDDLRRTEVTAQWPYPSSCHLTADTREELIEFVKRLGLDVRWIQAPGKWSEHFDLNARRRVAAVELGAVEESSRDSVKRLRAQDRELQG